MIWELVVKRADGGATAALLLFKLGRWMSCPWPPYPKEGGKLGAPAKPGLSLIAQRFHWCPQHKVVCPVDCNHS